MFHIRKSVNTLFLIPLGMIIAQNLDTIEIKLNSTNRRFFLPDDHRLIGKFIRTMETFYSLSDADVDLYAPSGRLIVNEQQLSFCYLTLVSNSGVVIVNNLPLTALSFTSPFLPQLFEIISPQESYISISDNLALDNFSILLGVYYDTEKLISFHEPNCCERVVIPSFSQPGIYYLGSVQKLTNKKIRRIEAVTFDRGTLITLVTKNNIVFRNIPLYRFGQYFAGYTIPELLYINDFEIDFERSFVQNVSDDSFNEFTVLNFYYYEH